MAFVSWIRARERFIDPFIDLNPHLKDTLQTHGARGRSFWLRFEGDYPRRSSKLKISSSREGEVGEFRSNGNQSIVWGIHPTTQKHYQFIVKKPVVTIHLNNITWPKEIIGPPTLQRNQSHSVSLSLSNSVTPSLCLSGKSLEEVVEFCVPDRIHQNNGATFDLARALLGLNATTTDRTKAFELWYEAALKRGVLRPGLSKDDYLMEFMNACGRAKVPLGSSLPILAWNRAVTEPPPSAAKAFETNEPKLLVSLCYQMHNLSHGEPWFLATRTVEKLIGKSHVTVATWMSALVQMGILERVEPGTKTKAPRYRYCEPTGSDSQQTKLMNH